MSAYNSPVQHSPLPTFEKEIAQRIETFMENVVYIASEIVKVFLSILPTLIETVKNLFNRIKESISPEEETVSFTLLRIWLPPPLSGETEPEEPISNPVIFESGLASRPAEGEKNPDCAICLEEIKPKEQILSCKKPESEKVNHVFHDHCVVSWASEHRSCPNCRGTITQIIG